MVAIYITVGAVLIAATAFTAGFIWGRIASHWEIPELLAMLTAPLAAGTLCLVLLFAVFLQNSGGLPRSVRA